MLRDLQYSSVKVSTSEISRIEEGPKTDSKSTPLQPARQNMVSCTVEYAQAENSTRERPMAQPKYPLMSVEDYLELNRNSKDIRYEYLDGDICMLPPGTPSHSIITSHPPPTTTSPLNSDPHPLSH